MSRAPWWCEDDVPASLRGARFAQRSLNVPRCADATCGAEDCPTCYPAQITEDDHEAAEV